MLLHRHLLRVLLQDGLRRVERDGQDVQQRGQVFPHVLLVLKEDLADEAHSYLWPGKGFPPASATHMDMPWGGNM